MPTSQLVLFRSRLFLPILLFFFCKNLFLFFLVGAALETDVC